MVMLVKERMTRQPLTVRPETSVSEAGALLARHRIRHLPVVEEGGALVGMFTDRDYRSTAASNREGVPVGEVMTRGVITVGPETQVHEAAKLMVAHRIGGLPVVKGGELVGIITETDLLRAFVELAEAATVERIAVDYQP